VTIVFALLAALGNAFNVTAQHIASTDSPEKAAGWRFVVYLFKNPLWLFGWGGLAGAAIFQALALHAGEMSVVQPLLVTELIYALVLRRLWLHQPIHSVTWWAAVGTCVGLAVFLAMSEPEGGRPAPSSHAWISAGSATVGAATLLALLATRGSPARRAALLATATAGMWALVAALLKATAETLSQFGVGGMFGHWPVYALAAVGLVTEFFQQATLHAGPLSVAQPLLVIVNPIVSIALSVAIFGEHFTLDASRLAVGATAFATMCGGVAVLTRTAPTTMQSTGD
jgi:drug/metabolite transporter (DMT)-like permease